MAQNSKNIANIHKIFTDINKNTKALIKWHLLVTSWCYAKIANIKTLS